MNPPKSNHNSDILLREIPSIQELLSDSSLAAASVDIKYLKVIVQGAVERWRQLILSGKVSRPQEREGLKEKILQEIRQRLAQLGGFKMKRVINGTGIILHTNLGRAPLPDIAKTHLQEIIENYSNLEIDLETGRRGDRLSIVEELLCLITGAEAAVVTNNNAAAILLALNSLCARKEVPVSRGELVEIGGSFRMPEVMKAGGAKMVEIGTTNRTHLSDYENAITQRTAAILKVHTSNYRVQGFTKSVSIEELAGLAHRRHLPLIYDMGSGVIEDLQQWGYPHEPVAREYVEAGVDVITFSGDKILGGPQAGIIIGKKEYIQKIKKNHLLRALRCDKITYALLEATLKLYLNPSTLPQNLPVTRMLTLSRVTLLKWGNKIADSLRELPLKVEVVDSFAQMGSGALPLEKIPSVSVRILPDSISVDRLARELRQASPAVMGHIEDGCFHINLLTVRADELPLVSEQIQKIFKFKE